MLNTLLNLFLILYILSALTIVNCQQKTIVVGLTYGSRSHVMPYFDVLKTLADRGHRIIYAAPEQFLKFSSDYSYVEKYNLGSDISYEDIKKEFEVQLAFADSLIPEMAVRIGTIGIHGYEYYIHAFQKLITDIKPDLILCDFFADACFDATVSSKVHVGTLGSFGLMGYGHAWYLPSMFYPCTQETTQSVWLSDTLLRLRANSALLPYMFQILSIERHKEEMKKSLGIIAPSKVEIWKNNLYFSQTLFGLDSARPLPPNAFAIGPNIRHANLTMDKGLKNILDQFHRNSIAVIYISFGSVVSGNIPIVDRILQAIEISLNNNKNLAFLWSTTGLDISNTSIQQSINDRLILRQWVNQKAILNHNAVKLFLTHGGKSSIFESIFYGKPMIVLPLFADQFSNSANVFSSGIGYAIKKNQFTGAELSEMFEKTLYNSMNGDMKENLYKLSKIAKLNSESQYLLAANMIEIAATVGFDHMIPADVKMKGFLHGLKLEYISSLVLIFGTLMVLRNRTKTSS